MLPPENLRHTMQQSVVKKEICGTGQKLYEQFVVPDVFSTVSFSTRR